MIADVTVVRSRRRTYRITCDSMQELATATHSVAYEANRAGWPDLSPDDPPAKVRLGRGTPPAQPVPETARDVRHGGFLMPEPIDPAPTVSFEDVTFRCVCGEVIIAAWDAANETGDECPECGEAYVIYAEPSVDITVKTAAGDDYCYVTY